MNFINNAAEEISLFCRINIYTKKDLPIRSSEMGMLIYLVKQDSPKTPMDVANFFKFTKSMATNMTSSLLKKGYLIKEKSLSDKRYSVLIPTEKAINLVNSTFQEYIKNISTLQEKLGIEDFDKLIYLINKANNILLEEKENV